MRLLTTILLLLTFSASWVQAQNKFTYGGNNAKVYVLGDILFPKYATSDSDLVLGTDVNGNVIPRRKGNGSGGSADSITYTTKYRDDTGKSNIRIALYDTADAIRQKFTQYATVNNLSDTASSIRQNFSNYYPVVNTGAMSDLNMNGYDLTGISTPVNPTDAVSLEYFQQFNSGFVLKKSVLATTATQLPSFTYDGDKSLVFNVGACPTVDGVTLHLNSRVLNKNSAGVDTAFNGIYYVSQLGDGSTQCIFTRSDDANTVIGLTRATTYADSGTTNQGVVYTQISTVTTVNVNPVTFQYVPLSVTQAGWGTVKVGNAIVVDSSKIVYRSAVNYNPSWIGSLAWSKITSTPTTLSGYGITDPIVLTSGSYANPSWITSLAWSKITGAPAFTTTYAALTDVNLTSLADGQLTKYNSGTGKWVNFTPTYISGNQSITLSGDVNGIGATAITTTLTTVNATPGTYGGSSAIPVITVDSKGRATTITTVSPAVTSVAAGTGVSVGSSAGTYTVTNTAPDQTVALANGYAVKVSGAYPNFTLTADTIGNGLSTRAYRQKGIDSVVGIITAGYVTPTVLMRRDRYVVAGTYTVTPPTGAKSVKVHLRGAGGGSAACAGTGTTVITLTGGGSGGAPCDTTLINFTWSSATLTIGAGGSAGVISGCPSCVGSAGGDGGSTTLNDGTNTFTAPGGHGSLVYATANTTRPILGGTKSSLSTTGQQGEAALPGLQVNITSFVSGFGANGGEDGKGGEGFVTANTAGNAGTGNGSGGGGCISNAAGGSTNSKNGAPGTDGVAIFEWFK